MAGRPDHELSDAAADLEDRLREDWWEGVVEPGVREANQQADGGTGDHDPADAEPTKDNIRAVGEAALHLSTPAALGILMLVILILAAIFWWRPGGGDTDVVSSATTAPSTSTATSEQVQDTSATSSPTSSAATAAPAAVPAAGTYDLDESAARRSIEAVAGEFVAAAGVIVVADDGTISGTFTFSYRDDWGDGRTGSAEATVAIGAVTVPLTAADTGFVFEATLEQTFVITSPDGDTQTLTPTAQVTGTVDLDAGTISLASSDGGGQPPFVFVR